MFAAARVYDGRPADQQRLAAFLAILEQFVRDLPNRNALGLFGRNAAAHELEGLPLGRTFLRKDPHAAVADYELGAHRDFAHRHAAGRRPLHVDGDAAVHLLSRHFGPMAQDANFGALVRRTVKTFRKGPDDIGRHELAILLRRGHGAVIADLAQNIGQQGSAGSPHFNQGETRIRAALADRDFFDAEGSARGRNQIEHLGQDQAVDDMAGDLHVLDVRGRCKFTGRSGGGHGFALECGFPTVRHGTRERPRRDLRNCRVKHGLRPRSPTQARRCGPV